MSGVHQARGSRGDGAAPAGSVRARASDSGASTTTDEGLVLSSWLAAFFSCCSSLSCQETGENTVTAHAQRTHAARSRDSLVGQGGGDIAVEAILRSRRML